MKFSGATIKMKATEQYVPVVLLAYCYFFLNFPPNFFYFRKMFSFLIKDQDES